jgi:hypothetical protein
VATVATVVIVVIVVIELTVAAAEARPEDLATTTAHLDPTASRLLHLQQRAMPLPLPLPLMRTAGLPLRSAKRVAPVECKKQKRL